MTERRGLQFKILILQSGPIPPSGGPHRERYLDHYGRVSLQTAEDEYDEVVRLLGVDAAHMPALDFDLVENDDRARRAVQRQKRSS